VRVTNIFNDRAEFRKGNVDRGTGQIQWLHFRSRHFLMTQLDISWLEDTGEWIVQDMTTLKIYLMDKKTRDPKEAVAFMANAKWSKKQVEDFFPEFPEIACKTPQKTAK
jgi:hypothetical protein